MTKRIYDYAIGEEMTIPVLIKSADVRLTKTDKKYIAFTFQDKSGQIDGKLWGASEEIIESYIPGRVMILKGIRELYNNVPQVKILGLSLLDNANLDDYIERVPMTKQEIEKEIGEFLFWITDPIIARVVRAIYQKYKVEFYTYPAAKKNHHAMVGGLSFHTLSMLRLGKTICDQYPSLNRSLLLAGILIHDIGKIVELSGNVGTEYTLEGSLIGHITLMADEITKTCLTLNIDDHQESVVLLKHMVLAHHGKLEYGSPIVPKLMEAQVLHRIDLIDAEINMMTSALGKVGVGEYTERLFALDNRQFYKPYDFT